MPTIEQNLQCWDETYAWPQAGEEFSAPWGGAEAQWYGTILPRIHSFVPAHTILEIAPGHGRWTQRLKTLCERLILVDLSESCIEACRRRFNRAPHISYHVNDGKSLAMIPDRTIDFVFCFDSLVHAEKDVVEAYIAQLAGKLTPNGVGFIHHSNIGMYIDQSTGRLPAFISNTGWRAESMTASRFKELCSAAGLQCIAQELVNWKTDVVLNDCFSLFTQRNSVWAHSNRVLINKRFMAEVAYLRRMMQLYTNHLEISPAPGSG
jgi:2-polyprenyl-3-methyl-5-hydroxy-6-metoxy-1,4-benzoquinol methylase